ncbi:MAG: molybdate ABC transporter substrate-binding protein [Treponema sp.]|jgi:molybdate transport system substrate-binding protein|nr:molybdate ABC transporter substrate-binding protein [Treponema sp.]
MKKRFLIPVFVLSLFCAGLHSLFAGGRPAQSAEGAVSPKPVTILVSAAASLEYSIHDRIIPLFQEKYPWITVKGTYDSSGKLQIQIEQGLPADVFVSAAVRQMNVLVEKNLVIPASVRPVLENKIVLIKPVGIVTAVTDFQSAAQAKTIALGDTASVPAGQYAREIFTALGIWDAVSAKASFGTNVTEVLNWVAEGSADAGVVYATDAAVSKKVAVIAEAPAGTLSSRVIYPAGLISSSVHHEEALLFIDFLTSDEAAAVFGDYGFSSVK